MSDVIDFVKYKKDRAQSALSDNDDDFCIDVALNSVYDIVDFLMMSGYDVRENPESVYDIITIVEAIKCLMKTIRGEEYPLHVIAKEMFKIDDPQEVLEDFLAEDDDG